MSFYNVSATPASNTTINSISAAGSASAGLVDDLIRQLAAQDRQFLNDLGGANTVGGTANAITITPSSGTITAAADGMVIWFIAGATNTSTSVTASVGGLTAEPVKKFENGAEAAVAVGDIRSGGFYGLRFRSAWDSAGGAWELIDPYKGELYIPSSATASTSGTDVEFTGVHSGAKRITISFDAVSTNGTSAIILQLGDSGGYETSGYVEAALTVNNATAGVITNGSVGFTIAGLELNTDSVSGAVILTKVAANAWSVQGSTRSNTTYFTTTAGTKTLSAELDRFRVRALNGTDTFDAGSINIAVE